MPEGLEPTTAPSGQEPQAPPATPPTTPTQDPPKAETFDATYVQKLRDEAAAQRVKARDLEAKLKEHEDAKLSESERLQKAAADATARADALALQLRDARGDAAIARHALAAGVKPELAQKLITLTWDGDDLKTDVKDAVASLIKHHPELVAQAASSGSATNPARSGSGASPTGESDVDRRRRLGLG